jgi:hypothetical protein
MARTDIDDSEVGVSCGTLGQAKAKAGNDADEGNMNWSVFKESSVYHTSNDVCVCTPP